MSEIHLEGGEISVLKALGMSGNAIYGTQLILRLKDFGEAELMDTLHGLIEMGYVLCDTHSLHEIEDVESANFRINSGYLRELREAVDPRRKDQGSSRRARRV